MLRTAVSMFAVLTLATSAPVFANEVGDHCKAYAASHHESADHCTCLDHAADEHPEMAAKIDKIHHKEDADHADPAVKELVAACFAAH